MAWDDTDIMALRHVLDRILAALGPLDGKDVLVLGSATGEVTFLLAPLTGAGTVVGLEVHGPSLALARERASAMGLAPRVMFGLAARRRITFPFGSFDAIVSDSVVHPSSEPTDIPPSEWARVLRSGGRAVLTDVLATWPLPEDARARLRAAGLDRMRAEGPEALSSRMGAAGFVDVHVDDITQLVRPVWEARRRRKVGGATASAGLKELLDDGDGSLGRGILYTLTCAHVH